MITIFITVPSSLNIVESALTTWLRQRWPSARIVFHVEDGKQRKVEVESDRSDIDADFTRQEVQNEVDTFLEQVANEPPSGGGDTEDEEDKQATKAHAHGRSKRK